ncbi:hypothetical protein [Citrobacter portucalensis]|uniref:hypothetical protein n=1 Tax=Citrobacter portucalensis TaxID=1639133 RepID=UPI0024335F17|nr:hypothetical protein [Citrobacter portucalensis]WFZ28102.1 hypothetical protein NFK62_18635 [Citrobacter portucalensis]WFZ33101.1 hypothetical protein NFK63_18625 [Citrobacter portucalensis]
MTNNHPAHGPVSLDRLHQISEILSKAAAQSDGGNLGYAMADAVKVIDGAIASFGAEPVAYMYKDKLHTDARFSLDARFGNWSQEDINEYEITEIPLYAAPPAPLVDWVPLGDSPYDVPYSMPSNLRELIAEEIGILFSVDDAQSVWNVCRSAAMLQAGNFREIPNSSTSNCREISETSTNCPRCGGRGTYHCPQMLGTVECECALPAAPKEVEGE